MERLIAYYRALPKGEPARDVMCTVLVRNYRSHPRLLWLPSHLFYGDALLAHADSAQTRLPQWSQLPGQDGANSHCEACSAVPACPSQCTVDFVHTHVHGHIELGVLMALCSGAPHKVVCTVPEC